MNRSRKGLATVLTFLGIEIDTEKQELRLPQDKLYQVEKYLKGINT